MNVSLTPDLERRVRETVESGRYANADEVVREALEKLFEADESREHRLARLDADLRLGLDQLNRGEGRDGDESRRRVLARLSAGA